jgi:hypothetical protein
VRRGPEWSFDDLEAFAQRGEALRGKPAEKQSYEPGDAGDGLLPSVIQLIKTEPLVKAAWDGSTFGLPDKSDSAIDMSLADQLALHKVPGAEIEAALRIRRIAAGARAKHDGYFRLTVEKALGWAAEQEEPSSGFAPPPDEKPPETPQDRSWLLTTTQANATPVPDVNWVWAGILPVGGLSIIVAPPKTAKSTVARCLTAAIAQGIDFLDRKTTRGPAIFFGIEERSTTGIRAVHGMNLPDGIPAFWAFGGMAEDPQEMQAQMRKAIIATGATFAAIDSLVLATRIAKTEDYSEVTQKLQALRRLAEETGCSIVLSHHTNKSGASDINAAILGSTAILGSVDTCIALRRDQETHIRSIETIQREGDDMFPRVLTLRDGWLYDGGLVSEAASEEAGRAIMQAMGSQKGG